MESQTTEAPIDSDSPFVLTTIADHELATVCCIGVCGVLGNGFVLVVLLHKTYRKKLKNLLIINQTFIDFITSIFLIITFASTRFRKTYSTTVGKVWCILIDSELVLSIQTTISTTNLVVITIERYLMVVYPVIHRNYISRRSTYITIGATWVYSTAVLLIFGQIPYVSYGTCMPIWTGLSLIKRLFTMVLLFWGPVAIFIVLYPRILYTIRKRSKVNNTNPADSSRPKKRGQSNLITVVISVTLAYVICWGPGFIYYIIVALDFSLWNLVARRYVGFLCFANSCVNPILYAFNYNDFKQGVRALFKLEEVSNGPSSDTRITTA